MKTLTNIKLLLFIVYICIIAHKTHSFSIGDRVSDDEIATEYHMGDESESIENVNEEQIHPSFGKRRLNSAEKYFNWASKSNRPMEYLRGKRFWLFGKKDEHKNKHEIMPNTHELSHSPSQGIWRSGIVGRRRR